MNKYKWLKRNWKYLLVALYIISPIDIIPDALLPFGAGDDFIVFMGALVNYMREKKEREKLEFEAKGKILEGEIEE